MGVMIEKNKCCYYYYCCCNNKLHFELEHMRLIAKLVFFLFSNCCVISIIMYRRSTFKLIVVLDMFLIEFYFMAFFLSCMCMLSPFSSLLIVHLDSPFVGFLCARIEQQAAHQGMQSSYFQWSSSFFIQMNFT